MINTDVEKANDFKNDHNKVMQQMSIYYILKITKIVIVITNFSYLLGMFWYIWAVIVEDYYGYDYALETEAGVDG